jgi:hypothetical protein
MKFKLKGLTAICLIGILVSLCLTPIVGSTDSDEFSSPANYEILFNDASTSDGAYSEMVAVELVEAFDNDAAGLINAVAIAELAPAVKTKIARLLVYGKSYGDLDVFAAEAEEMLTAAETEAAVNVLELILSIIDEYQARNTRDPSAPIPEPPAVFFADISLGNSGQIGLQSMQVPTIGT